MEIKIGIAEMVSVLAAIIFGAIVGAEREISGKPAGLRTNVLICMGASIFTIIAIKFAGEINPSSRIIAQIISGIGFLGAGAIIRESGGSVQGLTTAATIWVMAGIGIACGARYYYLAGIATILTLIVLLILGKIEIVVKEFRRRRKEKEKKPVD